VLIIQRKPFSQVKRMLDPAIQDSFDAKTSTEPVTSHMPLCAGYGALGVKLRHQLRVIADTGKLRHNAKVLRHPEVGKAFADSNSRPFVGSMVRQS
jgi:hypothetical protein